MRDPNRKRHVRYVLALFLLSLFIRLALVLTSGFDGLYGQDSFAYFKFAGEVQHALVQPSLPGPFNWPLGYPLLLATGFLLFGATASVGQWISLLTGSLIPPLIYLLSYEWLILGGRARPEGQRAGLVGGLLVAISGQMVQSSLVIMADIPALFWTLLSVWALIRYVRTFALAWLLVSVFALDWAVMTRWIYALLLFPWITFLIWHWRNRFELRHALAALILGLVTLAPQLLHSYVNPKFVLRHQWLTGWNVANALKSSFVNPDGAFDYALPVALFNLLPAGHPFYLFPLFVPALLLGLWRMRRLSGLSGPVLMVGWFLAIYSFLIGIPYESLRFPMALFPPIVIITALGLVDWWDRAKKARRLLGPLILVGCVGMVFWTLRGTSMLFARKKADLETLRWLAAKIPPDSPVYTFGLTTTLEHYTRHPVFDLYYHDPMNSDRLPAQKSYLFVNLQNLETQWRGLKPEENYRWFRRHFRITEMGRNHGYTLFEVDVNSPVQDHDIP